MPDNDILRIQPAEVNDATLRLEDLANRVEQLMQTEGPNLAVGVSAGDEVSERVASTLNDVRTAFTTSTDQGVAELRGVASSLRSHANEINSADQGFAV